MLPAAIGAVTSHTPSIFASVNGVQDPHHPLNVPLTNTPAAVEPPAVT